MSKSNVKVEAKSDEKKIEVRKDYNSYDKELDTMTTKSAKIRFLLSKNWTRSQVAKKLGVIYQHVRNVEITPVKKAKV